MFNRGIYAALLAAAVLMTQTGCWSSNEIEDLSLYAGLAIDKGMVPSVEKGMKEKGGAYDKKNLVTITTQVIPTKTGGSKGQQGGQQGQSGQTASNQYYNTSETGDSVIQIIRQFAIRRDRPFIGHHLKVIIVSHDILKSIGMEKLMDFVLRDNDIRPSCLVLLSEGKAKDTLDISQVPGDIPAFHLKGMIRNRYRTNKVLPKVTLTNLDGLINSKRSFVLQNVITEKGQIQFSGAGIIKGSDGKWIGNLNQEDVEAISWIKGNSRSGTLKYYANSSEPVIYEIKSVKSVITAKADGEDVSFHVRIESDGRMAENWKSGADPSKIAFQEEAKLRFEEDLRRKLDHLMNRLQKEYKAEVVGFGDKLKIQHPKLWKKMKHRWDEIFADVPVTFEIKLNISDFGSSLQ